MSDRWDSDERRDVESFLKDRANFVVLAVLVIMAGLFVFYAISGLVAR